MTKTIRSYRGISQLVSFQDRFEYLQLNAGVGIDTFGHERYLNQRFYTSSEWRRVRNEVISRDQGCDLGIADRPIMGKVFVHHMNPMRPEDIVHEQTHIFDPEYLITVSHITHNAIHYGTIKTTKNSMTDMLTERRPWDTSPWRDNG